MSNKEKPLLIVTLPNEESGTLFKADFLPVISLDVLAGALDAEPRVLEEHIRSGSFKRYTFKKEGAQYLGKSPDGNEFYVSGVDLKDNVSE